VLSLFLFSCKTTPPAEKGKPKKETSALSDRERIQFETYFFNASKEKILGNYDLAETYFSQALKVNPNSATTMYELANIYSFQNNKNQALFYSKKAAVIDPDNVWFQLLYADCLKNNRQLPEAAKVYEKLVKQNPENIDFYYELASTYLYLNKPNDALRVYDNIEKQIGVTEDVSIQKVKIYKALKNYDKAIEEIKKLIKQNPKDAKNFGILGELYQDKGQPEKALDAYNELLKVDPTNAYVHLSLADYYRSQKENEKAFEEIKIAFRSKDLDIDTKVKILLSYYSITEVYKDLKPDADELCKIMVNVHPNEAKAYSMYGDFLYRDKKYEEARTQFRKAIELDKDKYAIWNQLLIIDSELEDNVSLEKESKEAIELFPNQSLPYFFCGAAKIQLKKYEEAIEILSEGKEFVIGNPLLLAQFYANLGDAYNQLKKHEESDAAYEKALALDPNNIYVLNNFAYYLSLRKTKLDKAEAMAKKCNELQPNNSSYQDTYGWVLYQQKKYNEAKTWIGKAIENGGKSSATLLEHYGDVLFQLGEKQEAVKYWEESQKAGNASENIHKKITDKKLYE
jgi:tetratricopeptide (TPR) repeat protein